MATFEDLNPDQNPTENGLRMDMGRMAENVHALIAEWRAMFLDGFDPRPNMGAVANALLGRLRRAYEYLQEFPGEATGVSGRVGMTAQEILDGLISRRDTLRTFRDAPKGTINQTKNAVDALAAGFPLKKTPSASVPFLSRPLPVGW